MYDIDAVLQPARATAEITIVNADAQIKNPCSFIRRAFVASLLPL